MPRAAQYNSFGPPDVLEVVDVPEVHAAAGKLRISVRAAALNPWDFKVRGGLIAGIAANFPRGIGSDFAGVVDEVGDGGAMINGTAVAVGDDVFGWCAVGAIRDQLVVPASNVARKPAGVSWEVAGSLSAPIHTAHHCLESLDIGSSDVVLLSAAAGSVGIVYAQLAIARGARVIGTASPSNFALLESVGVTPTSYGPGLVDRVRALAPGGITAVQDNFGMETIDAGFELGVPASRICTIADQPAADRLGLAVPGQYQKSAALLAGYAAMVAEGSLVLPIQRVFPLSEVRQAFELLEGRHLSGKIVIAD